MSQTYYAILTAAGEAKLANAAALNVPLQISKMAVGDGNGALPNPIRTQTALVHENYRADLNTLSVDAANSSQIVAELVIPEATGGWWIREMGLYDSAGVLVAVCNCPPSYKPQLAEGSGRTQVLRMVLVVSSTSAVELKIDPSVVLATRAYADGLNAVHQAAADPHPQYTTAAEVDALIAAEMNSRDSKQSALFTTTATISLNGLAAQAGGDWAAALTAGDRILVKDQAASATNGLYVAAAGAWVRAADADANNEITPGMLVTIEAGSTLADTVWELTTNGPIVAGTTALTFELTAAMTATQIDAEAGTNNVRRMTALRVFQAIRSAGALATEALRGVLRVGSQAEVNAGALDDVAVSPKKLRWGFVVSMAASGYIVFPVWLGSLVIQWGTSTYVAGVKAVTFPMAFPTAARHVSLTLLASATADYSNDAVGAVTLTGFTAYQNTPVGASFYWLAVGN